MKALGPVVSENKTFFLCFSHCKSIGANDSRGGEDFFYVFPMTPPGQGLYGPQVHCRQNL